MRILPSMVMPVAIVLAGCQKPKPAPSIEGLTQALQRSAEQSLAAPSLANEQVTARAQPDEVIKAAAAAGGAAVRSGDAQSQVSILATIPQNNVEAFKSALRHEQAAMEKPSGSTRLIEVLLVNTGASPTP